MKKIFKEAHKLTRGMVKKYKVDYQAQFGLNLSYLLNKKEEEEMTVEKLAEMLTEETGRDIEVELNEWQKGNNHRLYLNMRNSANGLVFDGYIDIATGAVVVNRPGKGGRWVSRMMATVKEVIEDNKEEIIKMASINESKEEEKEETGNIKDEYYGFSNNMSSEDFEDITGIKKFDESYY